MWEIKAVTPGSQEARGINGRFWENITGNEESFTLNINVVSQNISSRNWDFGDGITSNEQNPMHTFSAPGTYIVTLTASNENGKKAPKRTIDKLPSTFPYLFNAFLAGRRPPERTTWWDNLSRWSERARIEPKVSPKTPRKTIESWMLKAGIQRLKYILARDMTR
ncbi:MAG: hypothetical protein QG646_1793 [Euryarchaeota archaeon]|nr:hypothetical protein [Euryarchaeota archaeon]